MTAKAPEARLRVISFEQAERIPNGDQGRLEIALICSEEGHRDTPLRVVLDFAETDLRSVAAAIERFLAQFPEGYLKN